MEIDLKKAIGLPAVPSQRGTEKVVQYINLKLAALGLTTVSSEASAEFNEIAAPFLRHHHEIEQLISSYLCPADQRIQGFLDGYFTSCSVAIELPRRSFLLDRHGLARTLSLPPEGDMFTSELVNSYRVKQGILNNPATDRRTTQGVFHVVEGGLPIPDDKKAVPRETAARLFHLAFNPPSKLLQLPFTSATQNPAECFVSLLLRPLVCPAVPGHNPEKRMEIRFFAPGNLVCNLDFVESIFGNAGDPFLPENDAGLDIDHWTGHTGCVILATHLVTVTKQAAGLPHWDNATERQRRDGMCWKSEDELYNDGMAFKLTCRDESGVMITVIADNYFGYCKKEVKTQISFSANLFGLCEEEHAGGTLLFPCYDLGEEFSGHLHIRRQEHSFEEVKVHYADIMHLHPAGYGVDRRHPDIIYVPENVHFDLHRQTVSWPRDGGTVSIKLLPENTYVRPSGYKVRMQKAIGNHSWNLIGTIAEPTFCHKPCTVSGGGKSEISKPITDATLQGPVFVAHFKEDFDEVEQLINNSSYPDRFCDESRVDTRPILSQERSLGSVIKLLTPAYLDYTAKYNTWLESIPQHIKELVFVVKRHYKVEWGDNWREHFSVDIINGTAGNELKCENVKLMTHYLRVGFEADGSWRTFGLRTDFHPASKWAQEDDISASVVVPSRALKNLNTEYSTPSLKFVANCEYRLFQRPDDAIHRGYDKQTEADFAQPTNFLSNYEPLKASQAKDLIEESIAFDAYTEPMRDLILEVARTLAPDFFVSSSHPRMIDGKPSKNPRYLQVRPDLLNAREGYLIETALRLQRRIPLSEPVHTPVNAVVPGRRNNPPDPENGIRSLAVYNPIHYMELPELFMEFICSMTGKSPSTTGAGSEGAMTKGPFNALLPIIDLNNALVSYILTGHNAYVTAAGYVGPHCRMDHDVSLLIPEIWCRMTTEERDPAHLIRNLFLEKCVDLEHEGRPVLSSRLGYRITRKFVRVFFGRMFNHPHVVFTEPMLKPELQDMAIFADGMANIVETQRSVAQLYENDGSINQACPPLRALLQIMLHDQFEGKTLADQEIRDLFSYDSLVRSDWYAGRLASKQRLDKSLWQSHVRRLEEFIRNPGRAEVAGQMGLRSRLSEAKKMLKYIQTPDYLESLRGTIGRHPFETFKS